MQVAGWGIGEPTKERVFPRADIAEHVAIRMMCMHENVMQVFKFFNARTWIFFNIFFFR